MSFLPPDFFQEFGGIKQNVIIMKNSNLTQFPMKTKQDGWLKPAYFSPKYKCFDQFLQTVKNETAGLNLVFKEFLQTSIPPLISAFYAKEYHDFPLKNFCLTVLKNFLEEAF